MTDGTPAPAEESLRRLFEAESVAIIGASADTEGITGRPLRFLEEYGYDGEIHPVNPSHDTIDGRHCHDSVLDIDGPVDVAMLLVPANVVEDVLEECGRKDVPFAVVSASGYGEVGDRGRGLERELLSTAERHDVRIVGPNSIGYLNTAESIPVSFATPLDRYDELGGEEGLSFVTQSGAYGGMLLSIAEEGEIGTKYWISTGNELDVDTIEVIDYLLTDPDVSMIVGYVEGFKRADRLRSVCRRAHRNDVPIVLFTVGQSAASRVAVSSHTGKMTELYEVTAAVLRDLGVVQVESVTEYRDILSTYYTLEAIPTADDRWGVLTTSGGAGALIADLLHRNGMKLAELDDETVTSLREIIPEYGAVTNPVDTTGNVISDPDLYERSISVMLEDEGVDVLFLQFGNTGDVMGERYEGLLTAAAEESETVIVAVFTGSRPDPGVVRSYRRAGIAVVEDPARFIRSIDRLDRFVSMNADDIVGGRSGPVSASTADVDANGFGPDADWTDVTAVSADYGLPVVEGGLATSAEEAVEIADELGFPAVVKAPGWIEHKTEADAVAIGLDGPDPVERAYHRIVDAVREVNPAGDARTVLVQPMVQGESELIVGIIESSFGPVMMVGRGGTDVEVVGDVAYKPLPMTPKRARSLLASTTVGDVIAGHRGGPDHREAVADLLVATAAMYEESSLDELEFNPVIVTEEGPAIVDALLK